MDTALSSNKKKTASSCYQRVVFVYELALARVCVCFEYTYWTQFFCGRDIYRAKRINTLKRRLPIIAQGATVFNRIAAVHVLWNAADVVLTGGSAATFVRIRDTISALFDAPREIAGAESGVIMLYDAFIKL